MPTLRRTRRLMAMLYPTLLVLVALVVLAWSSDQLVAAAASMAKIFGLSTLMIGLTVVAFGTSLPELIVSGLAAWRDRPQVGQGNAIGSNITNLTLVVGAAALLYPLRMAPQVVFAEIPKIVAAALLVTTLGLDGDISRVDGAILFGMLVLVVLRWVWVKPGTGDASNPLNLVPEAVETDLPDTDTQKTVWVIAHLVVSLALVYGASELFVRQALVIAQHFEVDDLAIGLTLVALGTSLPELAASCASALRKEADLALGNVVGSNLFNTLGVVGIPGLLAPGPIPAELTSRDLWVMNLVTLGFLVLAWAPPRAPRVTRPLGFALLCVYGSYLWMLFGA